jgi:L-lactate dehydrogenase (cytochrome)
VSEPYTEAHPPSLIRSHLEPIGALDTATVTAEWLGRVKDLPTPGETSPRPKPPLSKILNLNDFEQVSRQFLTEKSLVFISGASDDNLTRDANRSFFQRIWFRPRVLNDAKLVDMRSSILGCETGLPIFISPAGLATRAGPEGELALGRGAAATGIIYCVTV